MNTANINLRDLSKIPEGEFKQHFRDWMERDDVARSLQAKLRKDLIANFNKTTLGKKIINQAAITQRLTLSPLILALNTLVAEFLYAQNCHFTLSVFSTEVPYRNTLPDFENAKQFRFSEHEIFEIFDALSRNLAGEMKNTIYQEYVTDMSVSLLLVLLRNLLNRQKTEEIKSAHSPKTDPPKPEAKPEFESSHLRYLNKYLIILSKKVKEMSQNLERLQNHKNLPQQERKSVQIRKFENLNRSLEKISENLRQVSLSKRKNKRLTAVVTAIDSMAKQFERCAINFDQVTRGFICPGVPPGDITINEKSYDDWVKEMKTTDNGKIFLEKIENALKKALHREREKMEKDMEQRLSIQKDIIKTKYKQKFTNELIRLTSRSHTEGDHCKSNEGFEKKIQEFEAKHQELHHKIDETKKKFMERTDSISNKETQTADAPSTANQPTSKPVDTKDHIRQIVKAISEQERHIDRIVFDAKLRIQELEHESNQLDRTFREYLERQRVEKQKMRDTATSIWQSYVFGKSVLERKSATYRPSPRPTDDVASSSSIVAESTYQPHPIIPTINIETSGPSLTFENPFRIAQRKVLSRSKILPAALPPTLQEEPSAEMTTRHLQQPGFRLIEHNDDEPCRTKVTGNGLLLPPSLSTRRRRPQLTRPTSMAQQIPELEMKDNTCDSCETSPPATVKSSSSPAPSGGESDANSSPSPRGVFKLRRQLFTAPDNRAPSSKSNSSQTDGNGNKEERAKADTKPLKRTNKTNGDDRKKSNDASRKDLVATATDEEGKGQNGHRVSDALLTQKRTKDVVEDDGIDDEDSSLQSFHLDISTGGGGVGDDGSGKSDSSR